MATNESIAFVAETPRTARGAPRSQHTLALATGIHPTAIGRFERGDREPRLRSILRLADGLGVKPGRLLDDLGDRRLTPEEFEEHFGHLPTDGEG